MKFVVAVDLEGMPGVVGIPGMGLEREICPDEYCLAVEGAVTTVNAAVRSLFSIGAKEILVWDNHGGGLNLPPYMLDERVRLVRGPSYERWAGVDESFTGALLLGYHAMAGTPNGVLSHTYDSSSLQHVAINGVKVGEIAIDAHLAARRGAPVICVMSDEAGIREALAFLPWIEPVTTKSGFTRNSAMTLPPSTCEHMVAEAVERAVNRLDEMCLFTFDIPMEVEYRYMRMEQAHARVMAGAELVDAYTVRMRMKEFQIL